MGTSTLTQRDQRYAFLRSQNAHVVFRFPEDGEILERPLYDISVSGISFELDTLLPLLSRGTVIASVRVRVGECDMLGKMLVKHVTRNGPEVICGAVFYPATEMDLNKLNGLMAGIASHTVQAPS